MKRVNRRTAGENFRAFVKENVVGLMPAGGAGSRIAPLPMSKELFPIGFQTLQGARSPRPKVVSQYLLEKYAKAGIQKTFIILRSGKWDIPAYFGDGTLLNMHLAYLILGDPFGPPFTLDQAYPFIQHKLIAFGFPDILYEPEDVFHQLLKRQQGTGADLMLALYPAHDQAIMDMVELDNKGVIRAVHLKPGKSSLQYAWLCAVWTPVFTEFMHQFLQSKRKTYVQKTKIGEVGGMVVPDLTVGAVIQAAVKKGLQVYGMPFPSHTYIDIGTPNDLVKSVKAYSAKV